MTPARLALAGAALLLTMAATAPETSIRPLARPPAADAVDAGKAPPRDAHPRPRPLREAAAIKLPPLKVLSGLSPQLAAPPRPEVRTASATDRRPRSRPASETPVQSNAGAAGPNAPQASPVLPPLPMLSGLSPELLAPPRAQVRTASATDPRPRPRPGTEAEAHDTAARIAGPTDPRPRPRPTDRLASVAPTDAPTEAEAKTATPDDRRPQPRPEVAKASVQLAVLAVPTSIRPLARPDVPAPAPVIKTSAAVVRPQTEQRFGRKGAVCGNPAIKGTEIAPIPAKVAGCGLSDPVRITSVEGIPLSVPATVDCTTATAFQKWVRGSVIPAVGRTGGGVSGIEIAASYSCRPRNSVKGAKISEHGKGHAIDVSGIKLKNGQSINVLRDWGGGDKGRILATLWKTACGPFGTVLGPKSDKYHQNHIHLDTARYRTGSYCR